MTIARLNLAILTSWKEQGDWPLLQLLKEMLRRVDMLEPVSFQHPGLGRLVRISHYLAEFYLPLRAILQRRRFDVVISWQMRLGICYGILKRIFHRQKRPLHVIQDFHIDLTQTRGLYRLNLTLLKWAIPGIDYFFCTSTEEEALYSRMFDIPRDRILFLPLVECSATFQESRRPTKDYIFSFGKSDRDFDTLIRAVAGLGIKTYILSGKYKPSDPLSKNVSLLRNHLSAAELVEWIAASRLVVLPLKDYRVSAGQISMLEVMALARPLIITENMATREYATHQHSALFFQAGNDRELQDHIRQLWDQREAAEEMGQQARQTAFQLQQRHTAVFIKLLQRCAMDIQKGERP